ALGIIVARVCLILGTEVCSIYIFDNVSGDLKLIENEGFHRSAVGKVSLSPGEGVVGLVAERGEPLNIENVSKHPRYRHFSAIGEEPFSAFLGVPVTHNRRVLGVITVQQREDRRFLEDEEAFLTTLAAQLANVVARAEATGSVAAILNADYVPTDARYIGIAGAPGIAIGTAVVIGPPANLDHAPKKEIDDVTAELTSFDRAIDRVRADIEKADLSLSGHLPAQERALFTAYLHMLDDSAIAGEVRDEIRLGNWAQGAVREVINRHASKLQLVENSYLRERVTDVRELGQRVLAYLQDTHRDKFHFPEQVILIGEEVTASMVSDVPADRLKGIVSLRGSSNSHTAILARALNVPAVMGASDFPVYEFENQIVVVDGFYGELLGNPTAQVIDHYHELIAEEAEFVKELEPIKDQPSETLDGHQLNLWVNIGLVDEITRSLDRGAEGVGLFRTEIPFASRDRFPTEEEQRVIYREHLEAFNPRPVTMRTLDIGGDKALPYFPIDEDNPFLGWRGIRVTLDHPEIFLVQVRAMIKASLGLESDLRIMLPMVTDRREVVEAKNLIFRAYREVREENIGARLPQVGAMIEVPAAVHQARLIARQVDFLAVGSNDLTQYMLAVDRNNPRVANLYQEMHPAVLHALRELAKAAHAEQKGIGICGELAGTPEGAVLCVAMGYDVLSMNAANLPKVKWVIRNVSMRDCRRILARVRRMDDAEEILDFVRDQLIGAGLERAIPHHETPSVFL
ncbi:MAG: phosphoenolpyruvate--protein phosphotransferase, partial [Pseudomonadota bacterium]|nr:phosphoenolpyruvate--protein phosphotransferase [Pseudomonadota bacterium]